MIWLKSIGMGLVAVLILGIIYVVSNIILTHIGPTGVYSFSWRLGLFALIAVFLLGFGWEFWRLGR